MAYSSWSVVFNEQPSASKWNILGTNDAYFDGLIGSGTAAASFTPSPTGFSSSSTTNCKYVQLGKLIFMHLDISGTSNATTFTFTLPAPARFAEAIPIPITDNSANPTAEGILELTASSSTGTVKANLAGLAFTASNSKAARPCWVTYERS